MSFFQRHIHFGEGGGAVGAAVAVRVVVEGVALLVYAGGVGDVLSCGGVPVVAEASEDGLVQRDFVAFARVEVGDGVDVFAVQEAGEGEGVGARASGECVRAVAAVEVVVARPAGEAVGLCVAVALVVAAVAAAACGVGAEEVEGGFVVGEGVVADAVGGGAVVVGCAVGVGDAVAVQVDVRVAALVLAYGFAAVRAEPGVVVQGGVEVAVQGFVAVQAVAAVRAEVGDGRAGQGGFGPAPALSQMLSAPMLARLTRPLAMLSR